MVRFTGVIYSAHNLVNNSRYIGATTSSLRKRRLDHIETAARGQGAKLHEGIRAYSPESFIWEIIDTASNINELAAKEKH